MGKNIIWTNDSEYREGEEEYIKNEWIDKVRGTLGLGPSIGYWIPSGLVDAVKQAAIDNAIDKAADNNEETINFVEAYRDFAQEENIGEIIDEQFGEQLADRVDEDISDWLRNEAENLEGIDVRKSIPLIMNVGGDDGYRFLDGCNPYRFTEAIDTAGDLIKALREKMDGGTVELSVKDGNLVVSESVGYVGKMEDHIVKLIDKDFVNEMESLTDEELDKLYSENGFSKNTAIEDVIVPLAEKQGRTQDVVAAICEVYGWETGKESRDAGKSLDEICDAKSAEAEFEQEGCGEISCELERG